VKLKTTFYILLLPKSCKTLISSYTFYSYIRGMLNKFKTFNGMVWCQEVGLGVRFSTVNYISGVSTHSSGLGGSRRLNPHLLTISNLIAVSYTTLHH
jgi:hypothetical protein